MPVSYTHLDVYKRQEEQSCLYYLMTWHAGATLQARLDADQHFPAGEVVRLGIALLKGIAALHRLDIVHRDIKTDNVHLGQDGVLRILDLGVALSLGECLSLIHI